MVLVVLFVVVVLAGPDSTLQPDPGPFALKFITDETLDHDFEAFTEGLALWNGVLYESTGLEGMSDVRTLNISTGAVLASTALPIPQYGEGLTVFQDSVFQATYHDAVVHIRDAQTLASKRQIRVPHNITEEMWGLAQTAEWVVMSNGSSNLAFLDPATLTVHHTLSVHEPTRGKRVSQLNELELIPAVQPSPTGVGGGRGGEGGGSTARLGAQQLTAGCGVSGVIAANVMSTDCVVGICADTGAVLWFVDMRHLLEEEEREEAGDSGVLNGIAWDDDSDTLYATGKLWPRLFKGHLTPCSAGECASLDILLGFALEV